MGIALKIWEKIVTTFVLEMGNFILPCLVKLSLFHFQCNSSTGGGYT